MFNKKLKGVLAILIIGMIVFTFAGCGKNVPENEAPAEEKGSEAPAETGEKTKLDEIKEKGVLVLGTAADYPPYEFHKEIDGEDKIVGFDIEIARQIAEDIGVELEIKDMKFDGLIAALVSDKIDIIVAGMVPKPERAEVVDFSVPYYQAEQSILIRTEDVDKFKTAEDFKGVIVGAQKATVQEEIANKIEGAQVKSLSKITDLVLELQNNKVDAVVLVNPVATSYEKQTEGLTVPEISFGQEEGVAAAVNKGNAALLEQVDASLNKMMEEGQIDKFINDATLLADE